MTGSATSSAAASKAFFIKFSMVRRPRRRQLADLAAG
jgi:hypothetical protein